MGLLFEHVETLPQAILEIELLQNELKQVNETLAEIKANKKRIETQIAKKLTLCVKLNHQNKQKDVAT